MGGRRSLRTARPSHRTRRFWHRRRHWSNRRPRPAAAPTRGLDPFTVDEADVFFGRGAMTERLLDAASDAADRPAGGRAGDPAREKHPANAGRLARLRNYGLTGSAAGPACASCSARPAESLADRLDGTDLYTAESRERTRTARLTWWTGSWRIGRSSG